MAGEEPNVFSPPPPPPPPAAELPPRHPFAWQPLTPRGVAAFAFANYNRIFWIQTLFALGLASTVVWFLFANWTPVIRAAVRALPDQGIIREQRLMYPPEGPEMLAKSRYLGIEVRRDEFSTTAAGADVRVEFYPNAVRVCSMFGCAARLYPPGQPVPFAQQELIPWWAAWEPVFLGIVGILVALGFLILWHAVASVVFLMVRLVAYFADRQLNLGGSWRISAAAMLPGAIVLILAIVLYGTGAIDLLHLALAAAIHWVVQATYLIWAPFRLPRMATTGTPSANPFSGSEEPAKPA